MNIGARVEEDVCTCTSVFVRVVERVRACSFVRVSLAFLVRDFSYVLVIMYSVGILLDVIFITFNSHCFEGGVDRLIVIGVLLCRCLIWWQLTNSSINFIWDVLNSSITTLQLGGKYLGQKPRFLPLPCTKLSLFLICFPLTKNDQRSRKISRKMAKFLIHSF